MRRALPIGVLLVCSLLAGCSFATDAGPGTPAPTLTPVPIDDSGGTRAAGGPTPTRTPGEVPYPYPPGYGPGGVSNVTAATDAHQTALERTERYVLISRTAYRNDGRVHRRTIRRVVDTDGRYVERRDDGHFRLAVWESDGVLRARRNGTTADPFELDSTYVTVRGPVERRYAQDVRYAARYTGADVAAILHVGNYGAPRPLVRDGETLLSYRATRPNENAFGAEREFSTFGLRVEVDRRGLVRRMEGSAVREPSDGSRYATSIRYWVDPVADDSRTARPDWLSRTATANLTTREGYLVVENTGEQVIPLSTAKVEVNGSGFRTSLEGPLESGERLYVFDRPETASFTFSRRAPADGAYRPIPPDSRATVVAGNETVSVVLGVET